jgi:predicted ATPase
VSALFARHRNDPVPPLASARPGLPEGVVRVIEKTLSKSPADRYPSMARFAEALDAAGSGLSTPVPAPATDDGTRRNNLPRERTHFIGRERVLAECTRTLGDARLLTLTGVGGCGKTRLALQLAGQSMTTYPDGVWFVELAPLLEPDRVPLALAKVLGVMEAPGTVLVETVVAHLAPLRSLIVLDNCEHLMSAVCELSDRILAGTESTTLVATSREGLGVEGERLIAVQSLSVPPAGRAGTDAIESSESVRLFLDRARIVDAGFTLDSENAPTIAEIRRLDGIAQAIELAAARVRLLSVDEILARLDDRFRLLTGGARTALPRHQTLLATIEWSYDLLTDAERRLFRHLAVFAGGWTIAAATAVRGEHADEFEVLDLLGRLVGKSLVVVDREPDHSTRYSMLETVRQYVRQKLRDAGEGDAARARHFEYFLSLAEAFPEYAAGPGIDAHRARLVREQENLLAAIELCDHMPDGGEKGLRITGAVLNSWMNKGHLELCRGVAETTLARSGAQGATAYRARVLRSAGVVAFLQHRRESAQTMLEEALSICRELDDRAGAIRALGWLANVRVLFGELESARQCNEEALALARRLGQPLLLASAASSLAELERLEGHFDQAVPLYEEAVATYRVAGDTNGLGNNLYNVATIHLARGDIAVTRQRLGELASMSEVDNNRLLGMCALDLTSMLACATGFMTDAARLAGTAQANLEWLGVGRYPVDEQAVRPFILRTREGLGDAAFEEAFAAGRALTYEQALAEVRAWLAGAGNA